MRVPMDCMGISGLAGGRRWFFSDNWGLQVGVKDHADYAEPENE